MAGELILVATPIGNLADLSARAEQVLREADAIACEDTRHTMKLLSAKGITGKRLLAVHDHNETVAAAGLVALVERGERVALVTDAGTPAISDPGQQVVASMVAAGLPVSAVPGPAAFVMALAISGLPTTRFVFEGFLPPKGSPRRSALQLVAAETRTVVLYEAPHRMQTLLAELAEWCGPDRRVAVCRELTKRFEQVIRGSLTDVRVGLGDPQGEYVVVIDGVTRPVADPITSQPDEILDAVAELRAGGMSLKNAAAQVAEQFGASRREVYDLAVRT